MLAATSQQMRRRQQRKRRCTWLLYLSLCLLAYLYFFQGPCKPSVADDVPPVPSEESAPSKEQYRSNRRLFDNLSLTDDQCRATFPGLMREIDDTVALGPFKIKQNAGPLQARLEDGKLSIIHYAKPWELSKEMIRSRSATLLSLQRAVDTSPEPLPSTILSLNCLDQPYGTAMAYSRHADPQLAYDPASPDKRIFLMPHFSFYAWPIRPIGGIQPAARRIDAVEAEFAAPRGRWGDKDPRAVWRGTTHFNSIYAPNLRGHLVQATQGKAWADVVPLLRDANATHEPLAIEDFCRYKYVVHTEGITYSGRFHYHQMCRSVVVSAPLFWPQHTSHLAKPVFPSGMGIRIREGEPAAWESSAMIRRAWPEAYSPDEGNMVFVGSDWAELEAVVKWLEAHSDVAEGIASRQRELFAGGGYFTPAAEMCYWRALIRGWASVADPSGQGWEELEGVPLEYWGLDGNF